MNKLEKKMNSLLKEFNKNLTLGKSRFLLTISYIKLLDDIYNNHLFKNQLSEESISSYNKIYKKYYYRIIYF